MTAVEIVEEVRAAGGALVLDGSRIRYRVPEQAASLLEELRRHKRALLRLLQKRQIRVSFAHLLPYLGKRVWTPFGPGKLLLVDRYVTVGFEDGTKMRWYDPAAVIPYA